MGKKKRGRVFCGFCHSSEESEITGPLLNKDDIVAHRNCLFYSSNIVNQNTPDDDDLLGFLSEDVTDEIKRGRRLKCALCKRLGATVGCELKRCTRTYHYPCALEDNAKNIEDDDHGIFKIYCRLHKDAENSDKQKDESDENEDVVKSKRPRLSPGTVARRILDSDDGSVSDGSLNGIDPQLGPLESDLEDSEEMRQNSPSPDQPERCMSYEPKPSTSDALEDGEPEPASLEEDKADTGTDQQGAADRTKLRKNGEPKDLVRCHNGDADETDIDSDQDSPSILMPLVTKMVPLNSDHSVSAPGPAPRPASAPGPAPRPASAPGPAPRPASAPGPARCPRPARRSVSVSKPGESVAGGASEAVRFWGRCRDAGCVKAIFDAFSSAMNGISERILSDQASEEDCALSLRVLETSGMLRQIFAQKDRDYEERLLGLQREMEAVMKMRSAVKSAGQMKNLN